MIRSALLLSFSLSLFISACGFADVPPEPPQESPVGDIQPITGKCGAQPFTLISFNLPATQPLTADSYWGPEGEVGTRTPPPVWLPYDCTLTKLTVFGYQATTNDVPFVFQVNHADALSVTMPKGKAGPVTDNAEYAGKAGDYLWMESEQPWDHRGLTVSVACLPR